MVPANRFLVFGRRQFDEHIKGEVDDGSIFGLKHPALAATKRSATALRWVVRLPPSQGPGRGLSIQTARVRRNVH